MIIDMIIERQNGLEYDPKEFYEYVTKEEQIFFEDTSDNLISISRSMDTLKELDVKKELCWYIINQGYNPTLCDFVMSVDWL